MRKILALFLTAFIPFSTLAREPIVKDGAPNAEIIVADDAPRTTKLAAEELRKHLKKMSGAELPIVNAPTGNLPMKIYVGKSPATDALGFEVDGLDYGAYRIKSGDDYVALVGFDEEFVPKKPYAKSYGDFKRMYEQWDAVTGEKWDNPTAAYYKWFNRDLKISQGDEYGSFNAVNGFLRKLGVRWYMPGELGTIVPEKKTIEVEDLDETVHPAFPLRHMHFAHFHVADRDNVLWYLRQGMNWSGPILGGGALSHGSRNVHGRKEMKESHPEYYALFGGKRDTDKFHQGRPCLSSPEFIDQTIRYARTVFDVYDTEMISVMPQDGYGSICQCPLCASENTPERGRLGNMSDYVWGYVDTVAREVVKTHPDKKISCMAYGSYSMPPKNIAEFSPNVVFSILQSRAMMTDPEKRAEALRLRDEWFAKIPGKMIAGDHYLHTRAKSDFKGLPVYYPRSIAEDVKSLKGKSLGEFIEVTFADHLNLGEPILNHLNVYVTARLFWDPDRDVDDLLDEYYETFYGSAAKPMKAFVDYSERNWLHMRNDPKRLEEAIALFEKVQNAVDPESDYGKRVALLADYLKPMKQLHQRITSDRKAPKSTRCLEQHKGDFKLDGKFDDQLWKRQWWQGLAETQTGIRPFHETQVMFSWANDTLYVAVKCFDDDMENLNVTTTKNDDKSLWDGDYVDILIETQTHAYYQISVNPAGAVLDLDRAGNDESTKWASNVQVAVAKEKDHWAAEIAIPIASEDQAEMDPFSGLPGRRPTKTFPFYVNVCRRRARGDDVEISAFSPTGKDHFLVPAKFAKFHVR